MDKLLSDNGLDINQVLGYQVKSEFIDWYEDNVKPEFMQWYEDNIEWIIDKYQEEYPEVVVNNGDPSDYLDFDDVMDWARENLYEVPPLARGGLK